MKEGDYYPNLRYVKIEPYTIAMVEPLAASQWWLDQPAEPYTVQSRTVPALRVTIPEADWNRIMEIYRAHFHAENRNPGVRDAWEQYQIMCALAR